MSRVWLVPVLVATSCVGRAWNHDETERISAAMARDAAFDASVAISMHDMPRLAPPTYGPPVFVRDAEDRRRTRARPRTAPRAALTPLEEARERTAKAERDRVRASRERTHRASTAEHR